MALKDKELERNRAQEDTGNELLIELTLNYKSLRPKPSEILG